MKKSLIPIALLCVIALTYWFIPNNQLGETPQETWQKQLAAKKERREKGYAKLDAPDKFQEFQKGIRTRAGKSAPDYKPNYRFNELNKAVKSAQKSRSARTEDVIEFTERGPSNVPGRTRGLLVLSEDTWLAGASGGGIWKTTNGGTTWIEKSADFPTLAVSTLANSASNPNIIYAGTGEYIASAGTAIEGDGIFKSVDAGETWVQLSSTAGSADFISVTRIIVDPSDPNILLACSAPNTWDNTFRSTIMKSTDGGDTWTQVFVTTQGSAIEQLVYSPDDFSIQYAAQNGVGALKSVDGGDTWEVSNSGMQVNGRVELAIAPTNSSKIFASAVGTLSGSNSDLYVSSDAGQTWNLVNSEFDLGYIDFLGGQGWYDNTILVHPFNENIVYYGGVGLFVSEAGSTITQIENYAIENNTNFLDFVNFSAPEVGGILDLGESALGQNVEIRFGSGFSQKAHRFTVPADGGANGDGGAGIPDNEYSFEDYIDIPFEAWEVDDEGNDLRQLMVSFRDQQDDGTFNLNERDDENDPGLLTAREYVYIHDLEYNDTNPNETVAVTGGHIVSNIYFFWPLRATGTTFDPEGASQTLKIFLETREVLNSETAPIVDVYGQFNNVNTFNVFGEDVHPDQHNMVAIITDEVAETFKVLLSNDGGVFISNESTNPGINEGDWTMVGKTFNTSQFYGADKKPGEDQYIGGMQDNGTWFSSDSEGASASTDYNFAIGGDGFEVLWHSQDPNKLIGGSQNNGFRRSINGGSSWTSATEGLTGSFPFISKLATSKSNPDIIYTVSNEGVFKSTNFGESWVLTPISENYSLSTTFLDVEVSRANANIVWSGSAMTDGFNLHVSTDGAATFNVVNNYNEADLGVITRLASHPTEPNTAYALFSFAEGPKVLRTTNLGESWEDISGFGSGTTSTNGFPDVAVYSLYVRSDNPNIIWAGTEIGIVESVDNGATWNIREDFIKASVWDMKGQDDQIVIATHGRGIWTATVDQSQNGLAAMQIIQAAQTPSSGVAIRATANFEYDSTQVFINNNYVGSIGNTELGELTFTSNSTVAAGNNIVRLINFVNGAPYISTNASFTAFNLLEETSQYFTTFLGSESDFNLSGLSISNFGNFGNNNSLQSPHPYPVNSDLTATFLVPVVVNGDFPFVGYRDLAVIRPNSATVALEATLNGLDWIPVGGAYDATRNQKWNQLLNNPGNENRSALFAQQFNLTDEFGNGDLILLRFRLKANEGNNAWGWAIDDFFVQQEPTSTDLLASMQNGYKVFPNPTNDNFKVLLNNKSNFNTSLVLFNPNGQQVAQKLITKNVQETDFEIDNLPNGIYTLLIITDSKRESFKIVKTD